MLCIKHLEVFSLPLSKLDFEMFVERKGFYGYVDTSRDRALKVLNQAIPQEQGGKTTELWGCTVGDSEVSKVWIWEHVP